MHLTKNLKINQTIFVINDASPCNYAQLKCQQNTNPIAHYLGVAL